MRPHTEPSTFTTDRLTRRATAAGMMCCGGEPASGDVSVSNTSGRDWSPTRRPSASASGGGVGASRSIARATAESRTACAGQPGELASAGMSSHISVSTPVTPSTAPATRSPWFNAVPRATPLCNVLPITCPIA